MGLFNFKEIDIQKLPVQKLLIVVLTIISVLSIRSCRLKEIALDGKGVDIQFYQNQAQAVVKEKNKLGEDVASQKLLLIEKDKALEKQLLANSNLSEINNHYKVKLNTLMTGVTAAFVSDAKFSGAGATAMEMQHGESASPVMTEKEAKEILPDSAKVVPVGTHFLKEDKWYRIKGSVEAGGIKFDTLSFVNEPTINIGYKRKAGLKGYFQKQEKIVEVINPNPYTNTTAISNINFNPPKPVFYKTWGFGFGLGVAATIFAGVMLTR